MDLRAHADPPSGDASGGAASRVVVHVEGSLDLESRPELLRVTSEAFSDDIATWVVDLSKLRFMDSTGIAALVLIANDAEDGGSRFVVRNPSPTAARILEVTGLAERWPDV